MSIAADPEELISSIDSRHICCTHMQERKKKLKTRHKILSPTLPQ
jgi:hypothetical protein